MQKCIIITLCVCLLVPAFTASAAYAETGTTVTNDVHATTTGDTGVYEPQENQSFAVKIFVTLMNSISGSLDKALTGKGISISSVVYGEKDKTTGKKVPFIYSTEKGNVFGTVSGLIFSLFRSMAWLIMPSILVFKATQIATSSNRGKAMADWKTILSTFTICAILQFLIPLLIPIFLEARDTFVTGVAHSTLTGTDFYKTIQSNALSPTAGIWEAFLYLAMLGATLWFAMSYASVGMGLAVLIAIFPLASLTMNSEKAKMVINNWFKETFSLFCVPLFDAVILLFPTYAIQLGGADYALFTIMLIMMVIPIRTMLRRMVGMGGSNLEMAGIGMVMGATALAKSAVGGAGTLSKGIATAKSDMDMGNYHAGMAELQAAHPGISIAAMATRATGGAGMDNYQDHVGPTFTGGAAAPDYTERGETPYLEAYNRQQQDASAQEALQAFRTKNAATSWLDNRELAAGLSHHQKSDLYRKRGRATLAKTVGATAGAGIGGLTGAGLATIGGVGAMAGGLAAGGSLGAAAGGAVGRTSAAGLEQMLADAARVARGNITLPPHQIDVGEPNITGMPDVRPGGSGMIPEASQRVSITAPTPAPLVRAAGQQTAIDVSAAGVRERVIGKVQQAMDATWQRTYDAERSTREYHNITITPEVDVEIRGIADAKASTTEAIDHYRKVARDAVAQEARVTPAALAGIHKQQYTRRTTNIDDLVL